MNPLDNLQQGKLPKIEPSQKTYIQEPPILQNKTFTIIAVSFIVLVVIALFFVMPFIIYSVFSPTICYCYILMEFIVIWSLLGKKWMKSKRRKKKKSKISEA